MLIKRLVDIVRQHPAKTALIYGDRQLSYRELYGQIKQASYGLKTLEIQQGDCVAIILPNCPEFVFSFYAIADLKSIVLPLSHLFKEDELSYYLNHSGVVAIITDEKQAQICRKIIDKLNKKVHLIVVNADLPATHSFYQLGSNCPVNQFTLETPDLEQTEFSGAVLYQYSSGSTGRPKRVCRTQANLDHEINNFATTVKITPADTILCIVPLFHAHGLGNCLLAATCNGATLVILEHFLQKGISVEIPFVFKRSKVLELIQKEQITILPAVPYLLNTLAETPDDDEADLSSLRLCFSAGNFLSQDIFDRFYNRFGVQLSQLYGCTEAGSVAINLEDDRIATSASVGLPMQNIEITIVDEAGNEQPAETIGEVVICSKALTQGYDNLPELNQQAFKNGCFFTGDLGKKDAAGRLYITGRKRLLIDTGGHKVDPLEVEDILTTHPKVKEAVVVGVKGTYEGERIKAAIVLKESATCEEREIVAFCKERLAEFKVPKLVEFRAEIPRSPLGKILRKALV